METRRYLAFLGRVLPVVLSTRSYSIPRGSPSGRRFPPPGRVPLPVVLSTPSYSIPRSSPFERTFPPFPCQTVRFGSEIHTTAETCLVSGTFFGNDCPLSTCNLAEVRRPRWLRLRLRSLGPLRIGDICTLGLDAHLHTRHQVPLATPPSLVSCACAPLWPDVGPWPHLSQPTSDAKTMPNNVDLATFLPTCLYCRFQTSTFEGPVVIHTPRSFPDLHDHRACHLLCPPSSPPFGLVPREGSSAELGAEMQFSCSTLVLVQHTVTWTV